MNLLKRIRRILENSMVTGVPELVTTESYQKKFLKFVIFALCVAGFLWHTYSFLKVYWQYPTVMAVRTEYPDEFDLPALTVCNGNGIKSTSFCPRFPELCSKKGNVTKFCEKFHLYCDKNDIHENDTFAVVGPKELPSLSREEFRQMGYQQDELLLKCNINNPPQQHDCMDSVDNISVFDFLGLPNNCFTVNSVWNHRGQRPKIIKAKSVLKIRLKAERSVEDLFYTSTPFAFQLSLHGPYSTVNPFKDGFTIKPCLNYYVTASKQVNLYLEPPYATNCTDYMKLWRSRGGEGPLTKKDCTEECLVNLSVTENGCVDPYYIAYPNNARICPLGMLSNDARRFERCSKRCPLECRAEMYNLDIQEQTHVETEGTKTKSSECTSDVVFTFHRMEVVMNKFRPKYEEVEVFSYVGGYLGMYLGISLVALCDVLEFVLLFCQWCVYRVGRRFIRLRPDTRTRSTNDNSVQFHYNMRRRIRPEY